LLEFEPDAEWLPNPIDTELFKPPAEQGTGAIYISCRYLVTEHVEKYTNLWGVNNFQVVDRESRPIPYAKMPEFLHRYATYIDIKSCSWMPIKDVLSTTGLQALACGLGVLSPSGIKHGFPCEHSIEKVIGNLQAIYEL